MVGKNRYKKMRAASTAWEDGQLEMTMKCIKEQSKHILMEELSPFHETMTRRFKRDAANLEEYYHALKKEMEKTLKGTTFVRSML